MHTQNVNNNTATRKTPERWGQDKINRIVAQQQSLLLRLAGVWNNQLPRDEEEKEIISLINQLAENVLIYGVVNWSCKKPMVLWDIAYFWIQAQKVAVNVYELAGMRAAESARSNLAFRLTLERYYREENARA